MGMGVKALGAYLKYFRKQRGLSLTDIADDLDTSSSQIYRVEEGQVDARATLIAGMTSVLKAAPLDVFFLLLLPSDDPSEGERLAIFRLEHIEPDDGKVHPEIKAIALQMTDFDLGKWAEMGSKLLAERNRTQ